MPSEKDVTIRKRQQIDSSKRTMFIFVASAAFIGGIALVVSVFLIQQIVFHSKVILAKQDTISTLDTNLRTIDELKNNVRVLETNKALNSVKSSEESNALQVILDALPDNANADALGASLKTKFVDATEDLTIDNLTVMSGNEANTEDGEELGSTEAGTIRFSLKVSGPADKLKELLNKFEKSIRVIELTSFEIQASDSGPSMTLQGVAYYEPAQQVKLDKKVVKP